MPSSNISPTSSSSSNSEARESAVLPPLGEPGPVRRLRVVHRTHYTYSEPASRSSNELRMRPRETPWQKVDFHMLTVRPATRLHSYRDFHQNVVSHFSIPQPHSELFIESHGILATRSKVNFDAFPYGFPHRDLPECRYLERCHEFLQYTHYVPDDPMLWRAAIDARDESEDVFQTSYNIMRFIHENFRYDPDATHVSTSASEAMKQGHGVCQDFAHVALGMCRSLGIPARYVSGYLYDPDHDQLRGTQESHAWFEVFIRDRGGWFGLDPTNNKVCNENYLMVATGRDYRDVAPVTGDFYGGGSRRSLEVSVVIEELA